MEWVTTNAAELWRSKRRLATQVLNLGMVVASALMIWRALMVVTGSESPVVVVLSGSMEPAFHRGDILLLTLSKEEPFQVGEVVVYSVDGRDIPIVHRIIEVHRPAVDNEEDDEVRILTKGDNNKVDDRGLYASGKVWLRESQIIGRAKASVPYAGMFTILLNDYPALKVAILGIMGVFVILSREE